MIHWIKEHPYLSGGLVFALVVLFVVLRNRSNNAAAPAANVSGQSDALTALSIQTGGAVQAAQLQMQTQIAGDNAAVNITQLQTAAQTEQTRIAAGVSLQNILSGADVANNQTDAALQLGLAQLGITSTQPVTAVTLPYPIAGVGSANNNNTAVTNNQNAVISAALKSNPYAQTNPSIDYATVGEPTIDASGNVVVSGGNYTNNFGTVPYSGATLPSAAGLTWDQYKAKIDALYPNVGPMNTAGVGQLQAIDLAAQQEYITDPKSCHNSTGGSCAA